MGKTLVDGITVAYEDVGEGDNGLVLVHGHPFNRTMWQPQMDWIRRFNRARALARFEGEGGDTLTGSERLGDDIGIELSTHSNLEHEDEHEHDERSTWRAIVPDLRGYGESTVVAGKTTLDIFASDIAGLLDQLGIQKVVIGGLSMGGRSSWSSAGAIPSGCGVSCWLRRFAELKRKKVDVSVLLWRTAC